MDHTSTIRMSYRKKQMRTTASTLPFVVLNMKTNKTAPQQSPHATDYCPHWTCRTPALFLMEEQELQTFPSIQIK